VAADTGVAVEAIGDELHSSNRETTSN
jgi:uncharacterized membrane protein YccC